MALPILTDKQPEERRAERRQRRRQGVDVIGTQDRDGQDEDERSASEKLNTCRVLMVSTLAASRALRALNDLANREPNYRSDDDPHWIQEAGYIPPGRDGDPN